MKIKIKKQEFKILFTIFNGDRDKKIIKKSNGNFRDEVYSLVEKGIIEIGAWKVLEIITPFDVIQMPGNDGRKQKAIIDIAE